jgi:hypothetical protein
MNVKMWIDREYRKLMPDLVVRDHYGTTVWGVKEKPSKVTTWYFDEQQAWTELDKLCTRAHTQAYVNVMKKMQAWAERNILE